MEHYTATRSVLHTTQGEYILFMLPGVSLLPHAQDSISDALQSHHPDILYCDHEASSQPVHKPGWSPETLLSFNYIGPCIVVKKHLLETIGIRKELAGAQIYDFLLRATEQTDNVHHLPKVLYRCDAKSVSFSEKHVLQDTLQRRGIRGVVHYSTPTYSLRFSPEDFHEKVTILIPTKDRLDLLERCIRTIRKNTIYPHYEILIINNGSTKETLSFLRKEEIHWIDVPTKSFNFAHINNVAVTHVKSPLVLFLNNDTEIIQKGWLLQMVGTLCLHSRVGAVGAKLLFPNRSTQHAGVILGPNGGSAGHVNKHLPANESGYQHSNCTMRNFAAVTAACMLTRKELFEEVQGFDAKNLPISYNDVDYCLKLLAKGYRIVNTSDAILLHHEAASRDADSGDEYRARAYLRRTWNPLLRHDPYYNPNFSRKDGTFSIRTHPRGKSLLLNSHNLERQGAPHSLLDIAKKLKNRGYYIEVTSMRDGPLAEEYLKIDIPVHIEKNGVHPLRTLNRDAFDILLLNSIATHNLLNIPDITAQPLVWCIRENDHIKLSGKIADVSRVVFLSEATRNIYKEFDHGHFVTIPTGIDTKEADMFAQDNSRKDLRKEMNIGEETVITVSATICPHKDQLGCVKAASVLKKTGRPVRFFLVGGGEDTTYERQVKKAIRSHRLENSVHIIPSTSEILRHYAITDILVCNSKTESFPRSILEAMTWKLPIVATNIFGIPEQIKHYEEGLLIPPNDPKSLAHALQILIDDRRLAERLGLQARKKVEQCFTTDRMVDAYEKLFQEISYAKL